MKKTIALVAVAVVGAALAASIAVATPGSGATSTIVARGLATEKLKTRGNEPYDVVVQQLVLAPGGTTGWHTHPGSAVAVIKSGTLSIYDGDDPSCAPHRYNAGDAYVDAGYGHVHIGRNEGSVPAEIVVTYIDVPAGGGPIRIDAAAPDNCA
jgi:quercetin dioxygenase-like cupin family protein